MKVYVVQVCDWGWENDSVFDSKEKAIDYCLEMFNNYLDRNPNAFGGGYSTSDAAEDLEQYGYIEEFCAIETWEVQ